MAHVVKENNIIFLRFSNCVLYCRHVLHRYANEDVSLGAWFIGLDVEHIDDRRLCCGTPPGNIILDLFSDLSLSLCLNNN